MAFVYAGKGLRLSFYGFRDWGREPYQGEAYAWLPERQSWTILKKLSDDKLKVLPVCGEAYSDYQAFIEGALRLAEHVLHQAFPLQASESRTTLWP